MTSPVPKYLVSFDPGLREAGLAVFTEGRLTFATLVKSNSLKRDGPAWKEMTKEVKYALSLTNLSVFHFGFTLASEIPQVYREGKGGNVDPSDLTNLAGVVGAVIGYLDPDEVFTYLPATWKGQVPKDRHQPRILARLDDVERFALARVSCPKSKLHNVIDAIGIWLFHLGRIGGVSSKVGTL